MKWAVDKKGRWKRCDSATAPVSLRLNERLAPLVAIVNDPEAYAVRVGDEQGWTQELTAELFNKMLILGCNWSALLEAVTKKVHNYAAISLQTEEVLVEDCATYIRVITTAPDQAMMDVEDTFTICQVKERYYSVIRKLTGDKVKYDLKADLTKRAVLEERTLVNSVTVQNETSMRQNLFLLQELSKKLRAGGGTGRDVIPCLYPDVVLPPSSPPSTTSLCDKLNAEQLEAFNILQNLQPTQPLHETILEQNAGKAVLCSSLVKHADDVILQSLTTAKNGSHHHHSKEHQESLIRVMKAARDNATIAPGLKTREGDIITASQYFVTDHFTPFVHSLDCFKAYIETLQEACVVVNLQKQLKTIDQMHNHWVDKLMDVRRTVRSSSKKKRA